MTEINETITEDTTADDAAAAEETTETDSATPPEGEIDAPVAEEPQDDEPDDGKPSNREARYRRQLRETEADRDALAATVNDYKATVEALQRAEVERMAAGKVSTPTSLWASPNMKIADLLGADGTVDAVKAAAAIKTAALELGLQNGWSGPVVSREGTGYGGYKDKDTSSWEGAFRSE